MGWLVVDGADDDRETETEAETDRQTDRQTTKGFIYDSDDGNVRMRKNDVRCGA